MFSQIFNTALYRPLFNLLILFYEYLPGKDFGIAIICLTLVIKFLLYPLSREAFRIQIALQTISPQIKEIQKKYKEDKQKQTTEMLELYKKEHINPFAGFFVSLVQIPVLIALWRVFWGGFNADKLVNVYSFLPNPGPINPFFFGVLNLEKSSFWIALIAGVSQYFQTKTAFPKKNSTPAREKTPQNEAAVIVEKQMLYFFPFFYFLVLLKLPSAVGLYWLTSAVFSIIQQGFLFKSTYVRQ